MATKRKKSKKLPGRPRDELPKWVEIVRNSKGDELGYRSWWRDDQGKIKKSRTVKRADEAHKISKEMRRIQASKKARREARRKTHEDGAPRGFVTDAEGNEYYDGGTDAYWERMGTPETKPQNYFVREQDEWIYYEEDPFTGEEVRRVIGLAIRNQHSEQRWQDFFMVHKNEIRKDHRDPTLTMAAAACYDWLRGNRTLGRVEEWRSNVKPVLAYIHEKLGEDVRLSQVTPRCIEAYIESLKKRNLTWDSMRLRWGALNRIYTRAMKRGYEGRNPVPYVEKPRKKRKDQPMFTREKLQTILDDLKEQERFEDEALMGVSLYISGRGGEVAKVQVEDIAWKVGKEGGYITIHEGKTGTRTNPWPKKQPRFEKWLKLLANGRESGPLILMDRKRNTEQPDTERNRQRRIWKRLQSLGVKNQTTLRRSMLMSLYHDPTVANASIRALAGHGTEVESHYTEANTRAAQAAADAM